MLQICCVVFQREQDGPLEIGVVVNEDGVIIGSDGQVVPGPVWDARTRPWRGCLVVDTNIDNL